MHTQMGWNARKRRRIIRATLRGGVSARWLECLPFFRALRNW